MLVDHDAAFCERDTQKRGLDLEDKPLKGDCVIVTDSTFFFDGEEQIKINVRLERHKSRSWLLGFNGEALIELTDVGFFQETIGSLLGFDTVQTEFITESTLKSFVDAFAPASGLRRISRNRTDAELSEGASDLSQMALQDFTVSLGSEEEMARSVRIQGAEDAVSGDTVFEQAHTTEGALLIDEFHFIDFAGGIVHEDE